jgi:hypothetical protein
MLECRRDGPYLVVEAVPRSAAGRLVRTLIRVVAGEAMRSAGAGEGTRTREGAIGAIGYLFLVAAAGTLGALARVAPHTLAAGTVLAVLVGLTLRLVSIQCARYVSGRRLLLRYADSQATFGVASRTASRILVAWPGVSGLVGCADPRVLLERTLWDLALRLSRREATRDSLAVLRHPSARPAQVRDTAVALSVRDRDVRRVLVDLRRLAQACGRFSPEERQADTGTAISELASSTALVVDAYRELLDWPKRSPSPGEDNSPLGTRG